MIERVESVQSDFYFRPLRKPELLRQGEVPAIDRRAIKEVAPRFKSPAARLWRCEGSNVELPVRIAARAAARIFQQDDARTLEILRSRQRVGGYAGDREADVVGLPGNVAVDARELPVVERIARNPAS